MITEDILGTNEDTDILDIVFSKSGRDLSPSPFIQWHLRNKYEVLRGLFDRYLHPGARMLDVACGDGDGLVLAEHCQPGCELWGVDIDQASLNIAEDRISRATLVKGDMLNLEFLPEESFDVVHEFGATFFIRDWTALAAQYLRLVRKGGILLWELPQKWSTAHLMYMLSVAPRITEKDTKFRRILRSFSPSKYIYLSDYKIEHCLKSSGYRYEVIEHVPIWHFYCRGLSRIILDKFCGDRQFEALDHLNGRLWPRYSGFYIVIQKM